ncbi:MAG: hypothetical protein IPN71_15155 [Fibrobacteres bacterium]|nr:hypothetical protein [Fibrobacterota bacterium]
MLPFPALDPTEIKSAIAQSSAMFPNLGEGATAALALALCFSGRTGEERISACEDHPEAVAAGPESLHLALFEDNLRRLEQRSGGDLPRIASLHFPGCYESQIPCVSRFLARRTDLDFLHLVSRSLLEEDRYETDSDLSRPAKAPDPRGHAARTDRKLAELAELHPLVFPEPCLLERFHWLELVFLNEAQPVPWLSPGPIRVGIPHSTALDPYYSLGRWGAGVWFDVLLTSKVWPAQPANCVADMHPQRMIEHGSPHLTIAPLGSPKFDELLEACLHAPRRRRIAYHLSVEPPWVLDGLVDRIAALLQGLPDHEIVLRAHPHQWDHPEVLRALETFRSEPRLLPSRDPNYVQDYRTAQAVLCHSVWAIDKFPLASLRPLVAWTPGTGAAMPDPLGWSVHDLDSTLTVLSRIDAHPDEDASRLRIERDSRFLNAGRSVDAVIERMREFRSTENVDGWQKLPLRTGPDPLEAHAAFRRSLLLTANFPDQRLTLLRRARDLFPDDPDFHIEYSKARLQDAAEGLGQDRWLWTDGLEACAEGWRILSRRPPDDPSRVESAAWIRDFVLPRALEWAWKAAFGPQWERACKTIQVLLCSDPQGGFVRERAPVTVVGQRLAELERILPALVGDQADAWALLGSERMEAGRDLAAREALEKAVSLNPCHVDALFNLMLLDRIQMRTHEALAKARRLASLAPHDPEVRRHFLELSA